MTSKDFLRMRRLQKSLRLWLRSPNNFALDVDEDDMEELEVVPEN